MDSYELVRAEMAAQEQLKQLERDYDNRDIQASASSNESWSSGEGGRKKRHLKREQRSMVYFEATKALPPGKVSRLPASNLGPRPLTLREKEVRLERRQKREKKKSIMALEEETVPHNPMFPLPRWARAKVHAMAPPPEEGGPETTVAEHVMDFGYLVKKVWAASRDFVLYLLFLILFSSLIFQLSTNEDMFWQNNRIQTLLSAPNPRFSDLLTPNELWIWLQGPLLRSLYRSDWTDHQSEKVLGQSFVLGGVLLRQVRVARQVCGRVPAGLETLSRDCLPSLERGDEDTSPFGPNLQYRWWDGRTSLGIPFPTWGHVSTYPPSGFSYLLSQNHTLAVEQLSDLRKNKFLDAQTRVLFVYVTIWNPSLSCFTLVRFTAEILPGGGLLPSQEVVSMTVFRYLGDTFDIGIATLEVCVACFVVYYLFYDYRQARGHWIDYLKDPWNIATNVNLILILVAAGMRIKVQVDLVTLLPLDPAEYTDLHEIAWVGRQVSNLGALNVFVLYINLFRYIGNTPTFVPIFRAFTVAFSRIFKYLLLLPFVFVAFVVAFHQTYSFYLIQFRTLTQTALSLFRMLWFDVRFDELYESNKVLTPVLLYFYYIASFYLTLNMFVVILHHSYTTIMADPDQYIPSGSSSHVITLVVNFVKWKMGDRKHWFTPPPSPSSESSSSKSQSDFDSSDHSDKRRREQMELVGELKKAIASTNIERGNEASGEWRLLRLEDRMGALLDADVQHSFMLKKMYRKINELAHGARPCLAPPSPLSISGASTPALVHTARTSLHDYGSPQQTISAPNVYGTISGDHLRPATAGANRPMRSRPQSAVPRRPGSAPAYQWNNSGGSDEEGDAWAGSSEAGTMACVEEERGDGEDDDADTRGGDCGNGQSVSQPPSHHSATNDNNNNSNNSDNNNDNNDIDNNDNNDIDNNDNNDYHDNAPLPPNPHSSHPPVVFVHKAWEPT